MEDELDTAVFEFEVTIPVDSAGSGFVVSALLTFFDTSRDVALRAVSREKFVVLPTITAHTTVSER